MATFGVQFLNTIKNPQFCQHNLSPMVYSWNSGILILTNNFLCLKSWKMDMRLLPNFTCQQLITNCYQLLMIALHVFLFLKISEN